MKYVTPKYEYTLEPLADRLVTPERYGAVALAEVIEFPQPMLFELPNATA